MSGRPLTRLDECTRIVGGSTPSTSVQDYWNGDICWVTPRDLSELAGSYIDDTPRKITDAGLRSCAAEILPVGSVLFSSRAPIGHTAVTLVPMATNQGFKSFIPHPDKLDSKFLFYWLRANRTYLESLGVGATFKEVSKTIVSRIEIPLPLLPEQRRIAAILDQADTLRAKRRRALAQLDTLAQSIFLDMFGDPVRNPKRWAREAFGKLAEIKLGKMLDEKQQTGLHRRPYLRNANVQWHRFDLDSVYEMDFNERARKSFRLQDGDLLICEGGEPGRAAIWHCEIQECYYQKALHRCRFNKGIADAAYFVHLFWLLAHHGGFDHRVTSATIAHLTGEKLAELQVCLPPIALQHSFAMRVTAIDKVKAKQRASLAKLDALFAALQQRAFAGGL